MRLAPVFRVVPSAQVLPGSSFRCPIAPFATWWQQGNALLCYHIIEANHRVSENSLNLVHQDV